MNNELKNNKTTFSFESLEVWKKAVEFAEEIIDLVEQLDTGRNHYRLIQQLEASSTSISMNIAEGQGRYSDKEFIHFLHIARGSLFETITLLQIFYDKGWVDHSILNRMKNSGSQVGMMINGLINYLRNNKRRPSTLDLSLKEEKHWIPDRGQE